MTMFHRMASLILVGLSLAVVGCQAPAPSAPAPYHAPQIIDDPAAIAPRRIRAVWMQATAPRNPDMYGEKWVIAGYDSTDGQGDRVILRRPGNCFRPMLTRDGRRIVYSDRISNTVHVVQFDGSDNRLVGEGWALGIWRDPRSKRDYALIQRGSKTQMDFQFNPVYRVNIDKPEDAVLYWNQTPVTFNNFLLSRDGSRAAIEAPWPRCISAQIPNGPWRVYGRGCYTGIAPDDSYLTWHMDGPHRTLFLFSATGNTWWKTPLNDLPTFRGGKVGMPRWTNHVRYMTMVGPFPEGEHPPDEAFNSVHVHVGRFSPDMRQIEAWTRISQASTMKIFPDVWIEGGDKARAPAIAEAAPAAPERQIALDQRWPGSREGLIFLWDNALADNQFPDPAQPDAVKSIRLEPAQNAVYGPHHSLDLAGGWFAPLDDTRYLIDAIHKTGEFALEALATPLSAKHRDSGNILCMQPPNSTGNLVLEQWRGELYVYLRHRMRDGKPVGDWEQLCKITPGQPVHVIASCRKDRLEFFVNGQPVGVNVDIKTDLAAWENFPLRLGSGVDGRNNAKALLEGVAMYNRPIGAAEAAGKYQLWAQRLKDRKPVRSATVLATLRAATPPPDLAAIAPYRRALVENVYEVQQVIAGQVPDRRIIVAQWAMLDGKTIKLATQRQVGQTYRLDLSPMEDHAELRAERTVTAIEDVSLPAYYDRQREPMDLRTDLEKMRDAVLESELDDLRELLDKDASLALAIAPPRRERDRAMPMVELAADNVMVWRKNSLPVVSLLIERGATADIWTLARAGMRDQVAAMLDKDPALLEARDALGRTPLRRAALIWGWNIEAQKTADMLLSRGATMDIFVASFRGDAARVAALLQENPALAKATDEAGATPLHWAARPFRSHRGCIEAMRLLIAAGADVNAVDPAADDMTPLHSLCDWGGFVEQVDLLVQGGAKVNALTRRAGWTPLDMAIDHRKNEVAAKLRALGGTETARKRVDD